MSDFHFPILHLHPTTLLYSFLQFGKHVWSSCSALYTNPIENAAKAQGYCNHPL